MSYPAHRTRVKVCCIASKDEANTAIKLGADALGLVGPMPSGPGVISQEMACEVAAMTPPPVASFLLTSQTRAEAIAEHAKDIGASTVQIVNHIDVLESEKLLKLLPATRRVQVIHVEDESAIDLIDRYQPFCHAFLLDSGKPGAAVPTLGGTGMAHDWSISATIVEQSSLPVFLAGGLTADNVGEAIVKVRPYGVDLCSGVRTNDQLDPVKLSDFMHAVRQADSMND